MSMREAKPNSAPRREIATTRDGRDITRAYSGIFDWLLPQDSVLESRGGDYTIYEELLRDDQVASTFQQRRLAVTSTDWKVIAGGGDRQSLKAADLMRECLMQIGWDNITDKMLFGVFYGFAVAECLWDQEGDLVHLVGVKVRKQRRFVFDRLGGLRLRTSGNIGGEPMPERKFWHFSSGADNDDEPYGLGLAHRLYWPVYFKRNGMRLWLTYLDKFGMPTAKGTYPIHASEEEKRSLLDAIQAIQTDSGIIVPEGMGIELIEAARGGQVSYEGFIDRMNAAITKVVLSQTMTTDAGGGHFKADVQMSVRNEVVKADADLICDSFNRSVAVWLTSWNFPGAKPPQVWRRIEQVEDRKILAERDKILFDMGFRPSLAYIRKTYGGDWQETAMPH